MGFNLAFKGLIQTEPSALTQTAGETIELEELNFSTLLLPWMMLLFYGVWEHKSWLAGTEML